MSVKLPETNRSLILSSVSAERRFLGRLQQSLTVTVLMINSLFIVVLILMNNTSGFQMHIMDSFFLCTPTQMS